MEATLSREFVEDVFKRTCEKFKRTIIKDDREIKELAGLLIHALACASDFKALLLKEKQEYVMGDPENYASGVSRLSQKGLAYEERKLYSMMLVTPRGRRLFNDLEWVDFVISSLRDFETTLKTMLRVVWLEMKLSFEGHE